MLSDKILIVEDNAGDLFLLREYIKNTTLNSFEIYEATRADEAIELLKSLEFTIVLLDLYLPDGDGIETLKKISIKFSNFPIVVLSGLADEKISLEALKLGAQDYLIKGQFDEYLLEKTVRYAIERKRNQQLREKAEEELRQKLEHLIQEKTKELNEALKKEKQLVELKNQFVAIASHEFRTPLSTIYFATNFLQLHFDKVSKTDALSKLDKIEAQVKHMTALLDDVIMVGRSELNKIQVIKTEINLRNFVDRIIEEVIISTKKTHQILLTFEVTRPTLYTDDKLLRNILINLLTNAIKFSPGEPHVLLHVQNHNRALRITTKDSGIGISDVDQARLFEAFFRGKNTSEIAGTGLGLSIVKKAVDLLHGEIELESKINAGTTIKISLPFEEE